MSPGNRIFARLALTLAVLAPSALAQRPPAPSPPTAPPPGAPSMSAGKPVGLNPGNSQPSANAADLVVFLRGNVATNDGTPLPNDVLVERVCNARVRQQVYAAPNGSFSMDLGSRANAILDASGDGVGSQTRPSRNSDRGIPRNELTNCEVRASASGFHSNEQTLFAQDTLNSSIDVGTIVVERLDKVDGLTLSATPYKAPKDAQRAYEKGLQAEKAGHLSLAHQHFQKAVKIYPKYANAWFQLGKVLEKENDSAAARTAYTQAAKIDTKFLPPYLALSLLAFNAADWPELLNLTGHILALDPLNYSRVKGYILDLDSFDYAEAYFYNAVANFNLNKMEEAEKSGLKAEHLDVRPRFPQLHLLLAEIFARKNNFARAITELQTYLDQAPSAPNADQVRQRLADLQKSTAAASAREAIDR